MTHCTKQRKWVRGFPSADPVCVIALFACAALLMSAVSRTTITDIVGLYADLDTFVRESRLLLAKYLSQRSGRQRPLCVQCRGLRAAGLISRMNTASNSAEVLGLPA